MRNRSECQLTEKRSEFWWRLFFLEITRFWQKNALNLPQSNWNQMKIRVEFVYSWIKLQKKPPPPRCEILATRLFPAIQTIIVIFNFTLSFLTPHVALFFWYSIVYYLSRTEVESRTQRSKPRPMIQKNPRSRPRADFSRPRTGMLKAKDTRRRCSRKRNKRSSREEMPISKVKWKKLMAMDHFQQFNVLGREQGIFEDLQATRPRI